MVNNLLNRYLDRLVHREIYIRGRAWSAFRLCGYSGLALASLLAMTLVLYLGLSPWIMAGIILVAVSTLLGLTMATKIITGEERIINYHHQITVLAVTTALLWLLDQPILPYLDPTLLGVGLFIACGRVGCLMMGCCHGRPHSWGVCYRAEHAVAGFTPYFVGVRLFPIQAIEALWVFCIVLTGSSLILSGQPAGAALAWYLVGYSCGRFFFEFRRGDPDRSYWGDFSEPQWIALSLTVFVAGIEWGGVLPLYGWHIGAAALLVIAMIIPTLNRRFLRTAKYQLLHPYHVKEVAEAIELVSNLAAARSAVFEQNSVHRDIYVGCTSLGIQISASRVKSAAGYMDHYALSAQNGGMTEESARILAGLILQLRPSAGPTEIIKGNQGVYHLLVQA